MGLIFYSGFGVTTVALFYWGYRSLRTPWQSWQHRDSGYQTALLICAAALHFVAIIGWLVLALTNASALIRELVPGGPAPYFLLPWFTGLFIMGIAQFLADSLDALVRKEYDRL